MLVQGLLVLGTTVSGLFDSINHGVDCATNPSQNTQCSVFVIRKTELLDLYGYWSLFCTFQWSRVEFTVYSTKFKFSVNSNPGRDVNESFPSSGLWVSIYLVCWVVNSLLDAYPSQHCMPIGPVQSPRLMHTIFVPIESQLECWGSNYWEWATWYVSAGGLIAQQLAISYTVCICFSHMHVCTFEGLLGGTMSQWILSE